MNEPIIDDDEIDETTSKEEGGTRWLVLLILAVSALGLGFLGKGLGLTKSLSSSFFKTLVFS